MKNIYFMLDLVVQTTGQRMDKAILEVFDKGNRTPSRQQAQCKRIETNNHFLVGKKFILPYQINPTKEYGYTSESYNSLRYSNDWYHFRP